MLHKRIHLIRGIQANALRIVAPWFGMYAVLMNHGLTTHSILLCIAKCHHSNNLQLWPLGATYCNNTWGASSQIHLVIFLLHFRKTKYNNRSQRTFLWWKISCLVNHCLFFLPYEEFLSGIVDIVQLILHIMSCKAATTTTVQCTRVHIEGVSYPD